MVTPQEQMLSMNQQGNYLFMFCRAYNKYKNTYLDKRLPKQFIEDYLEEYQIPDKD